MAGIREILAVVLGAILGVALVAAPRAMLKLSILVGPTRRRRHDGPTGDGQLIADGWLWVVRVAGVACLAVAGYIAYNNFL